MIFKKLSITGSYIIEVEPINDERGFFTNVFYAYEFYKQGLIDYFPQCNIAYNKKAYTFRGMHYQIYPFEEAKLVRCLSGAICDIILDLRKTAPTYKHWESVVISSVGKQSVYIPKGCAHGYLTLVDNTEVFYHLSEYYNKRYERGIRHDDPMFEIKLPYEPLVISSKDLNHEDYKENE